MNRGIRALAICIAMMLALNFGMSDCKALDLRQLRGESREKAGEEGPIYDVPDGSYVEALSAEEYQELLELQ